MSVRSMSNELQASGLKPLDAPEQLSLTSQFTLAALSQLSAHADSAATFVCQTIIQVLQGTTRLAQPRQVRTGLPVASEKFLIRTLRLRACRFLVRSSFGILDKDVSNKSVEPRAFHSSQSNMACNLNQTSKDLPVIPE